jgi:hypothetical protein
MPHFKISGGVCLDHEQDALRLMAALDTITDIAHNGDGQSWIKLVEVNDEN